MSYIGLSALTSAAGSIVIIWVSILAETRHLHASHHHLFFFEKYNITIASTSTT